MLVWFFLVFVLDAVLPLTAEDSPLISVAPQSMNVSEGATVAFECQTTYSIDDVIFGLLLFPIGVNRMEEEVSSILPGGGIKRNVSFVATALTNETTVICIVTHPAQSNRSETAEALLLVQGPPDGVSNLRVEYVDVCCTLVAWDDPYTLSGVPITGYSTTVNNINTGPDTGTLNNTLCLTEGPGSYVVKVIALIDAGPGDATEITVDIPKVKFDLSVQQVPGFLEFTVEISKECSVTNVKNVTITLNELALLIDEFTRSNFTQEDNNQIMESREFRELLLNRHLQALAFVTFANGIVITTVTKNFSTFDVQTANYSINSVGMVCVVCELVPGTQALGCHVILDCDNGEVIEQDFFRSELNASGCFPSSSTPTNCSLLVYDIESNSSVPSNPAVSIYNVVVPGVFSHALSSSPTTMDMVTTSVPIDSGSITTVIVAVAVVMVLTIFVIVGALVGVYLYKTVRRNHKQNLSNDQEPNTYQLPQRQDPQGPLIPSIQYSQVETPAVGNTIVLPVENHPVTYSYIDIQRLGVSSVDIMMDHKQLMLFVAPRVSSKWYHMGVALALTPPFLEDIEQNSGGSPERCISDVFQAWREQRSRPYTWESLLIALRAVGVEELEFARELELQVQSLQQQQQTMATTSLPAPGEMYSRLQHSSNQSTPSTTPCRHIPTTDYESLPHTSNTTVSAATTTSLIKPGLTLDQLISELTSQFASKWKGVGVALALTPPSLETIATRNCQEPTMCMTGVVQLWKHREPRPYTLRTLITVLKSIGEHEYALQLEHYQVTTTT